MSTNFDDILKKTNFIGSKIKIKLKIINGDTKNDIEEINIDEGIVKNIYFDEIITISLYKCKIKNINYIGIQMFQIVKILKLTILQEGNGTIEDDIFFKLSKPLGSNFKFRSNNKYLNSLLPIQIFKLIQQKQINLPNLIKNKKSAKIFFPRQISLNDEKKLELKNEYKMIYTKIWKNKIPPKLNYYPSKWFFIKNLKTDEKLIKFAFNIISKQEEIGVALRGRQISRWGEISLITFSTQKYVFTFDIISLEMNFILRFKNIFESTLIKKIFYDSRCSADYLLNCHNIKLENVFDIQASNMYFLIYNYSNGYLLEFSYPLPNLIKMYLGIDSSFLFFEYKRMTHINEDVSIWFKRPLTADLEFGVLCDVIYLLDLQHIIKEAILNSLNNLTEIYLNSIRYKYYDNYYNILDDVITVPIESAKILQKSKSIKEYEKMGFINENVVYQNIIRIDPNLIYSKDIIHQNVEL